MVLKIIEFNEETQEGVIICSAEHLPEILGFLALYNKKRIIPLRVSGTLNALKNPL